MILIHPALSVSSSPSLRSQTVAITSSAGRFSPSNGLTMRPLVGRASNSSNWPQTLAEVYPAGPFQQCIQVSRSGGSLSRIRLPCRVNASNDWPEMFPATRCAIGKGSVAQISRGASDQPAGALPGRPCSSAVIRTDHPKYTFPPRAHRGRCAASSTAIVGAAETEQVE